MSNDIRACRLEDLPAIAELFAQLFLKGKRVSRAALARYLEDLIFNGPDAGEEPRSLVFVGDNDAVRGFIGVWSRRMMLNGWPIEAAVAGSLMVDPKIQRRAVGSRLMTAFLNGPQDFRTARRLTKSLSAFGLGLEPSVCRC